MQLASWIRLKLARLPWLKSILGPIHPRMALLCVCAFLVVMLLRALPGRLILDAASGSMDINSTLDGLYDFFDGETHLFPGGVVTPDASQPQFVFVNSKYPTPNVYKEIIDKIGAEKFVGLSMAERCETYFEKLYEIDSEWSIHQLEDGYPYNGYIFDTKERFFEDRLNEFKTELEKNEGITDDEKINKQVEFRNKKHEWESKYQREFKESFDTETAMSNWATHLRVFSQCYLENKIAEDQQQSLMAISNTITCQEHEKRLFKFLTRKYPTYVRWNREELHELPVMAKYLNDASYVTKSKGHDSTCFTRELKEAYNGRGIAISAADKHVGELSSLILVLRAIDNKLPIQIVHRGDLSEESQKVLTLVARSTKLNLDAIPSHKKYLETYFADAKDLNAETFFPPQEIWYVDTTDAVSPDDQRFVTYGNKLLTLLFSSFEDTVVLDTDTVPFVDINNFILESDVYKNLGAFFFKDRMLYDRITGPELTYFKKLLPTKLDTAFFDIPELTNHTMNNRFFGEKYKHVQESGMVAVNKKRHMRSTLFINILQMWSAATTRVHGDKELFWLGFSIAGDEDYYLNKYGVGAVGSLNPNSNRLLGDSDDSRRSKLRSHMLCTTHPAHLSGLDDHTLLWMNSGFITCKRENEAENDIKMDLYKNIFDSAEQLKDKYLKPQKIEAILVPPPQERVINNDLGEPASGWDVMFGCGGYLYCAYDRIGASDDPFYMGTLVEYDERQQVLYDYLGEMWVYYEKVIKG